MWLFGESLHMESIALVLTTENNKTKMTHAPATPKKTIKNCLDAFCDISQEMERAYSYNPRTKHGPG